MHEIYVLGGKRNEIFHVSSWQKLPRTNKPSYKNNFADRKHWMCVHSKIYCYVLRYKGHSDWPKVRIIGDWISKTVMYVKTGEKQVVYLQPVLENDLNTFWSTHVTLKYLPKQTIFIYSKRRNTLTDKHSFADLRGAYFQNDTMCRLL